MDETTLTSDPYLCKCWCKRGVQTRIPASAGTDCTLHLFGGYNVADDRIAWTLAARRNSEGFIAWLEQLLLVDYPTQTLCVVLDNASFHRSAAVQAAAALFAPRLQLLYLPAYSPQLNPIERYWQHLKRQVQGNRLCADQAELTQRLKQQLAFQNDPAHPRRYHVCH